MILNKNVEESQRTTVDRYLYVHLDDGLSDESSSKECPERYEEMATGYPSQIK